MLKQCFMVLFSLATICVVGQNRGDVVISEIFADPTPQVGLPNAEYLEIKNNTTTTINITGWRLSNGTTTSTLPNFNLLPDSSVCLVTSSQAVNFSPFGTTVGITNFPSLDNNGAILTLTSPTNKLIHAVEYSVNWHTNNLKKDGGWSLEMIDTKNICTGAGNWKSSNDAKGGTPGKKNSIAAINNDNTEPIAINSYAIDENNIIIQFDEPIDSVTAANIARYSVSNGISLAQATVLRPLMDKVQLRTNNVLTANTVYTVTINGIVDCSNKIIAANTTIKTGLAVAANTNDVIINEILFNPKSGGSDYVEVYNKSNKLIDLSKLFLANRNSTGAVANIKQTQTVNKILFPEEYAVFTENENFVKSNYTVLNPKQLFNVASLPSYNDDSSNVVLLNNNGNIVDELAYSSKWHFELIQNKEGVSLERISFNSATQNSGNWHSAAATAGFGTPTYKNSQFGNFNSVGANFNLATPVFSPDQDGFEDFCILTYEFTQVGNVANIIAFDARGRLVKTINRSATLGQRGEIKWNGLDDKNQKIPAGIYTIFIEVFNLQGKREIIKKSVVVAYR